MALREQLCPQHLNNYANAPDSAAWLDWQCLRMIWHPQRHYTAMAIYGVLLPRMACIHIAHNLSVALLCTVSWGKRKLKLETINPVAVNCLAQVGSTESLLGELLHGTGKWTGMKWIDTCAREKVDRRSAGLSLQLTCGRSFKILQE